MRQSETFRSKLAAHSAAIELESAHAAEFQRLLRLLRHGPRFQLLVLQFNDVAYRDGLIRRIDEVLLVDGLHAGKLVLKAEAFADFPTVESALLGLGDRLDAIHLVGGEAWFDAALWEAFNIRREAVAHAVAKRILVWLTAGPISRMALDAQDLWAWRAGVFDFTLARELPVRAIAPPHLDSVDARTLAERAKRIAELREFLRTQPPPPDDLRLPLLDELAHLLAGIGNMDEALRIRREEELPVYEKLGDVRSLSICQAEIALGLLAKGDGPTAVALLRQAHATAVRLKIPEAKVIEDLMSRLNPVAVDGQSV